MQSGKTFQRRMGSHSLIILTLGADLVGAWASFLIGHYVFPAYVIVLEDVMAFLGGILSYITGFFASVGGSLQGGDIFLLFLGAGALFGLLFGMIVATRDRYGDVEFAQGFVAFLVTVLVSILAWFIYGLVTHWHPVHGAFVYPQVQLAPNQLSAWICLVFYMLTHLISYLVQNAPQEHLSRADPKGPIYAQIDECYQRYNVAMMRFDPRPIPRFKTPIDLCFHEGESKAITWNGRSLVVPKLQLHPENEAVLRAELARQIMYFNGPDLYILRFLNSYPHRLALSFAFILLGNFIVVPDLVQQIAGARWSGERVLDADRYAFLLGQGEALRQILKLEQEILRAQGLIDTNFPTLSERIDQLDALIKDEHQQMQQLGIPLPQQSK
jgi:hypothetical protein